MKNIHLCFSTPNMKDRFSPAYGKKYPGAGWMKYIPAELQEPGCVVQEENNEWGKELIAAGSDPRVLICLESPIYAASFYDSINFPRELDNRPFDSVSRAMGNSAHFKHRLLFWGGTEPLYFPSFDNDDIQEPMPWGDRKHLCMVTAKKHYSMLKSNLESPSFQWAMKSQLHDYRYEALRHFIEPGINPLFDLYGRGFANECDDKIQTIKNYKFSLCFENGSYPGYITEKIIDCFVAGVVPIYMGAPDVRDHIPEELFIDASEFKDFYDMDLFLLNTSSDQERYMTMIRRAQHWLRNLEGKRYNNKVFADHIIELCQ